MTRPELRELVRQIWHDSPKSWVMTGLAFARLAPHIIEALAEQEPSEAESATTLADLGARRVV